ncbi:MAG: hydroxyacid dehydrogenase [Chloroflexia bacterium]|nr:hydroxyacid dehydrogenase [Chloroflexia bacterium]
MLHEPEAGEWTYLREQLAPNVAITAGLELPDPADYHVLVAGRPSRAHLTASSNLRALVIPWAGLPNTTRELLLEFPHLAVHNLHHNAVPVAEMVVALLLAAAKFIVPMDRALRAHDWTARYQRQQVLLLQGKTALILGYGAIGRHVAGICRALGMQVLALRRRVPPTRDALADEIHPPGALPDLLPRAQALLICLPHTPETDGLIGAAELDLLPPDAVLVNVGRGPIVDQEALYQALAQGRLLAAGLDVWYNYPADEASRSHTPPADYAFHELDNVVMSPHRAGGSQETGRRRMEQLAALLNAAARGEAMPNPVDLAAGY